MSEHYELTYKIIILGETTVGKSSLIRRFVLDEFYLNIPKTVGIFQHLKILTIGNVKVTLNIWDTVGQERYSNILPSHIRGSKAAIIVYDITNEKSFEKVNYWINLTKEIAGENIKIMLIGNKADLDNSRKVSIGRSQDFARSNDILFFETSCMNSSNVEEAFKELASKIHGKTIYESVATSDKSFKLSGKSISLPVESIEVKKKIKKKSCC